MQFSPILRKEGIFLAIINVRNLTKEFKIYHHREGVIGAIKDLFHREYRIIRAVDGINMTIEPGEIVGYIGANGAGKSTTIKMLTGILVPTAGEVVVNGFVPYRDREEYTRHIGVVFGQRSQLWWDIAVLESLKLLRRIYRVPEKAFRERLAFFDDLLGLGEFLHLPVRRLSLGQRMRCELAAALLHNPPLLFLDEPTIGLDVLAKARIREFLLQVNREFGTTILLTTHDLKDIEALCPRVIIIDKGRILYDGGREDLLRQWGHDDLEEIVRRIYQGQRPGEVEAGV
ncbi:MAG: viologen exporter family transport system ATP-binding protein [Eubacteriales bacterium]|nr:viologen exporter family transport system ATP-binding protein [Eubacteriales bacterium]